MMVLLGTLLSLGTAAEVDVLEDGAVAVPPATVRFVEKKNDSLQIALVTASDTQRAGNVIIMQKLYDSLCDAPCTVEMEPGWYEFRFSHEDKEWFKKLEVKSGPQTYTIRRSRAGLAMGGLMLTSFGILPAGIPMMVAGFPKYKWSEGI